MLIHYTAQTCIVQWYAVTRLDINSPWVLIGQEKSKIWLFRRMPEGVKILLPKGLFSELKHKKKIEQVQDKLSHTISITLM